MEFPHESQLVSGKWRSLKDGEEYTGHSKGISKSSQS